jgi:outer membrane protein OmpA-like peptidoglycan-associated protein
MVAAGLGSFVSALQSHGLPGFLTSSDKLDIHNEFRRRFNLPPEAEPERREAHGQASDLELLRAKLVDALAPHDELYQPQIAGFAPDSAELEAPARAYLDRLAETLRPRAGQLLLIEGHAADAGERFADDDRWLAGARARAVREYLIEMHEFAPERVEARAWLTAGEASGADSRRADARLITPERERGGSDG